MISSSQDEDVTDSRANATGKHPPAATRCRFSSHVAPAVLLWTRAASSQWLRAFETLAISMSSPSFKTMPLNILGMPKTRLGLADFIMCDQWVEAGGMVLVVAMSGCNAVQLICYADRRPFVTSTL